MKSERLMIKRNNKKQTKNHLMGFMLFCLLLIIGFFLSPFTFHLSPDVIPAVMAAEKWQGVDESVVEKYAKEHGREAAKPLINIEQGDLPLFLFLLAGTVGGFAAGYYWRRLTAPDDGNKTTGSKGGPKK